MAPKPKVMATQQSANTTPNRLMPKTIRYPPHQKSSTPASGFQLLGRQEAESIKQKSLATKIMVARTSWQMHQQANARKAQVGGF
jgi:hypothetical protein